MVVGRASEGHDQGVEPPGDGGQEDRARRDGRAGSGVAVPGEEEPEQHGERAEACREQHDPGDPARPVSGGDGRPEQQGDHEQGADSAVGGDDREGDEPDESSVRETWSEAHGRRDARIEGERHERAVECRGDEHGDHERDREAEEVGRLDGEHVAEEDGGEIGRE